MILRPISFSRPLTCLSPALESLVFCSSSAWLKNTGHYTPSSRCRHLFSKLTQISVIIFATKAGKAGNSFNSNLSLDLYSLVSLLMEATSCKYFPPPKWFSLSVRKDAYLSFFLLCSSFH